jgi:hypothetical protein
LLILRDSSTASNDSAEKHHFVDESWRGVARNAQGAAGSSPPTIHRSTAFFSRIPNSKIPKLKIRSRPRETSCLTSIGVATK